MTGERQKYNALLEKLYNQCAGELKPVWSMDIWPIIRIQALFYLYRQHDYLQQDLTETTGQNAIGAYLRLKTYLLRNRFEKGKVLQAGYQRDFSQVNGRPFNPYLTPFDQLLREQGMGSNLFLFDNRFTARQNDSDRLSMLFFYLKKYYEAKVIADRPAIDVMVKNLEVCSRWLGANGVAEAQLNGMMRQIKNVIIEHEAKYRAFKKMLAILRPRLTWSYCFYDYNMMALHRAANALGIVNVEYQHSVQSQGHPGYSGWPPVDSQKIFFPAYCWAWSEPEAANFVNALSGTGYRQQAIAGGNLYIALQKGNSGTKTKSDKAILVSLQGQWIPDFIEHYIKNNSQYTWYLRWHPRYPADRDRALELAQLYPGRVEVALANNLPMHEILSMVSYNITSYSGTAIEAHAFGVENIIFGELGLNTFRQQVEDGVFFYVENEERLHDILAEQRERAISTGHMIAGRQVAAENLKWLLRETDQWKDKQTVSYA